MTVIHLQHLNRLNAEPEIRQAIATGKYKTVYILDPNRFWQHLNPSVFYSHFDKTDLVEMKSLTVDDLVNDVYAIKDAVVIVEGYQHLLHQLKDYDHINDLYRFELLNLLHDENNNYLILID